MCENVLKVTCFRFLSQKVPKFKYSKVFMKNDILFFRLLNGSILSAESQPMTFYLRRTFQRNQQFFASEFRQAEKFKKDIMKH